MLPSTASGAEDDERATCCARTIATSAVVAGFPLLADVVLLVDDINPILSIGANTADRVPTTVIAATDTLPLIVPLVGQAAVLDGHPLAERLPEERATAGVGRFPARASPLPGCRCGLPRRAADRFPSCRCR
jgi:hypothetical protein